MNVKKSILYLCILACLFISCGDDTDTEPPSTPSGLALRADSEGTLLTWSANDEVDLAGYNIYCAEAGVYYKVNSELIDKSNHPSFRDPRELDPTETYYVVTAVDKAGNESADSDKLNMGSEIDDQKDHVTKGSYLYFDGVDDHVEIQDTPKLSGGPEKDLTIELWAYPKSYGDTRRALITKYKDFNNKEAKL